MDRRLGMVFAVNKLQIVGRQGGAGRQSDERRQAGKLKFFLIRIGPKI